MKTTNFSFKPAILLVLAIALIGIACTQVEDNSRSGSLLTITSVIGQPGGQGGQAGSPMLSDTCDNANNLPQDPEFCTVFNDNATVGFKNDYLQIGGGAGVGTPGFLNDIIITRYRVDYIRSNNRNTPGIDVPFGIDGTMNVRVPIRASATGVIMVVRHEAKLEPPLAELSNGPSEGVLTANAQLQFFGKDVAGRTVSATGFLEIHFANYGETGGN